MSRRALTAIAVSAVTVASTFLPWARTGSRVRSSHQLVDVADRAGVLPEAAGSLAELWYLIPALGALVLIASALPATRLAGSLTATLGALVGVGGLLLHRSPLEPRVGATVGLAAGAAAVCVGLVLALAPDRRSRT